MNPTATLTLSRETLSLSDSLIATIRIDAPSAFTVSVPKDILDEKTSEQWRVRPTGDATVKVGDGRHEWSQSYRLDPYVPGESVELQFAKLKVKVGAANEIEVSVPAKMVKVETQIANARAADARPITGWEDPPLPPQAATSAVPFFMLGLAMVLFWVAYVFRRRNRPAALGVPPFPERLNALAALEGRAFAEALSHLLRQRVGEQHTLSVESWTTSQIVEREPNESLRTILEWCDSIKFAGRTSTSEERDSILKLTREFARTHGET